MLKDWHKEDVFNALKNRGWNGPLLLDAVSGVVGESYAFTRDEEELELFFIADIGTGLEGKKSIEAARAIAKPDKEEFNLWLHRTRDAKWKKELHSWAEQISSRARIKQ